MIEWWKKYAMGSIMDLNGYKATIYDVCRPCGLVFVENKYGRYKIKISLKTLKVVNISPIQKRPLDPSRA
jgi:hypothetical protein